MSAAAPYAVLKTDRVEFFDTLEQAQLYAVSIGADVHCRVEVDGSVAYYERVGVTTRSSRTAFCISVEGATA